MEYWENIFLKENIIFWTLKGPENGQNSNLASDKFFYIIWLSYGVVILC